MGHLALEKPYVALQQRLDKNPVGAPATDELYEILRIRFSAEEAAIGARMPMVPAPIDVLAGWSSILRPAASAFTCSRRP